jgi:ribulose-phosphate 3-epimerase
MLAPILIAPSLLAADFARAGEELRAIQAAGADWLHLDIMDGHFVPNISFGPPVIARLKPHTTLPFDVHLMIAPVDAYIPAFAAAGANRISIHPGVVLNPATPIEAVLPVLDMVDTVMMMTVNPGFGGQPFLDSQLPRIAAMRAAINATGRTIHLQVDGGITPITAPRVIAAGADVLVAGTAIFAAPDYAAAITALRSLPA